MGRIIRCFAFVVISLMCLSCASTETKSDPVITAETVHFETIPHVVEKPVSEVIVPDIAPDAFSEHAESRVVAEVKQAEEPVTLPSVLPEIKEEAPHVSEIPEITLQTDVPKQEAEVSPVEEKTDVIEIVPKVFSPQKQPEPEVKSPSFPNRTVIIVFASVALCILVILIIFVTRKKPKVKESEIPELVEKAEEAEPQSSFVVITEPVSEESGSVDSVQQNGKQIITADGKIITTDERRRIVNEIIEHAVSSGTPVIFYAVNAVSLNPVGSVDDIRKIDNLFPGTDRFICTEILEGKKVDPADVIYGRTSYGCINLIITRSDFLKLSSVAVRSADCCYDFKNDYISTDREKINIRLSGEEEVDAPALEDRVNSLLKVFSAENCEIEINGSSIPVSENLRKKMYLFISSAAYWLDKRKTCSTT